MGYVSITDIICGNPEMKERVEKWNKFQSKLIPEISQNKKVSSDIPAIDIIDESTDGRTIRYGEEYPKIQAIDENNKKDENNKHTSTKHVRTKRTYSLDKITNRNIRAKADIAVGSGKIS